MWEIDTTSQLLNFVTIGNFPIVHNKKSPWIRFTVLSGPKLAYLCKINKDLTRSCYLVIEFWVLILTLIDVELIPLNAR
jgi:hypothetical protein